MSSTVAMPATSANRVQLRKLKTRWRIASMHLSLIKEFIRERMEAKAFYKDIAKEVRDRGFREVTWQDVVRFVVAHPDLPQRPHGKGRARGVPFPRTQARNEEIVRRVREDRETYASVARDYGITREAVRIIVASAGLPSVARQVAEERLTLSRHIVPMLQSNMSYGAITKELSALYRGVKPSTVAEIVAAARKGYCQEGGKHSEWPFYEELSQLMSAIRAEAERRTQARLAGDVDPAVAARMADAQSRVTALDDLGRRCLARLMRVRIGTLVVLADQTWDRQWRSEDGLSALERGLAALPKYRSRLVTLVDHCRSLNSDDRRAIMEACGIKVLPSLTGSRPLPSAEQVDCLYVACAERLADRVLSLVALDDGGPAVALGESASSLLALGRVGVAARFSLPDLFRAAGYGA